MEKLAIVMPVYNEEEAIGAVLDKWVTAMDKLGIEYTINPYNDGSKDNSYQVIQAKAEQYPGKVIAHTKPNGGHGPTILHGYREAAAAGYDWVFQIDSDDEMGPEGFPELWNNRENYDFLVGIRDGRKQALPRKIISAVSRLSVRLFYGKSIWDVNTPYRLMRVSAFKDVWDVIPSDTFAPNVIISGMAARKKLRCFETRVPQHDRQTGEVSIKKWKLFKAAAKSFCQTIRYSLTTKYPPQIMLSILFVFLTIAYANVISLPWIDEISTIDTAVNVLQRKEWTSCLWPYTYNPLHLIIQIAWLYLWEISHTSAVALGVVIALIAFVVLIDRCHTRNLFNNARGYYLLLLGFWILPETRTIITNARIDTLNMLFAILTVDALWDYSNGKSYGASRSYWKIFLYSFLLMLSGVYAIPVIAFLCLVQIVGKIVIQQHILAEIKYSLMAFAGVGCAFVTCLIFYLFNHNIVHFVYTYFSFSSTLSGTGESLVNRIISAYYEDGIIFLFLIVAFTLGVCKSKSSRLIKPYFLISMIPLIMCLAGRYSGYYHWLFYIPSVVFITYSLSLFKCSIPILFMVIAVTAYGGINIIRTVQNNQKVLYHLGSVTTQEKNVLLLDAPTLYYNFVAQGKRLWRMPSHSDAKIESFVKKFDNKIIRHDMLHRIMDYLQRHEPSLPPRGLIVSANEKLLNDAQQKLLEEGFSTSPIIKQSGFFTAEFMTTNNIPQ